MKFGKEFESHLTNEWRQQYMFYTKLKYMIYQALENAPKPADFSRYLVDSYYREFQELFLTECNNELTKVNNFFQEKLAEARRRIAQLKIQLLQSVKVPPTSSIASLATKINKTFGNESAKPTKLSKLRHLFSEFYLTLILLQNYKTLNYTAFRKILKKYDKRLRSSEGSAWFDRNIEYAPFATDRTLDRMITDVENLYTKYLADGDRSRAMAKLRVPPLGHRTKPQLVFRSGFSLGMFFVLIFVVIAVYIKHPREEDLVIFIKLYRGPLTWVLFNFFMALNVAGWERYGINHVLIFEIDPRNHLQPAHFVEIAAISGILWFLSMIAFLLVDDFVVTPYVFPLGLIILWFGLLFNPIPIIHFKARLWLMRLMGRTISAPFYYVGFADFWFGDQLNSLVICTSDFYYMIRFYTLCYFGQEPYLQCTKDDYLVIFVSSLPAWFRLAQCLRRFHDSSSKSISYLINAGKYATSFFVMFFSTMFARTGSDYDLIYQNPYFWGLIVCSLISSVYCVCWDIIRDFGLFQVWKGRKIFLRENLVYPTCFYHFALIQNFLIRFIWIWKLAVVETSLLSNYSAMTVVSVLELFRRFIWNYLRLENEHLNNCGRFRATRDIFIGKLDVNEERLLQHMMDHDSSKEDRSHRFKLKREYF